MGKKNYLDELAKLLAHLRGPRGCPWDRKQELSDLKRYLLEETHEIIEAQKKKDFDRLREELGDLLFIIFFYAQLLKEKKGLGINRIAKDVVFKMKRRHPHVFNQKKIKNIHALYRMWNDIKRKEKTKSQTSSVLDNVPRQLPLIKRATQLQAEASKVGFDWPDKKGLINKIKEEIDELEKELKSNKESRIASEIGDILFSVINLARYLGLDTEKILDKTINKFIRRFKLMEKYLRLQGKGIKKATLAEMDRIWNKVKSG